MLMSYSVCALSTHATVTAGEQTPDSHTHTHTLTHTMFVLLKSEHVMHVLEMPCDIHKKDNNAFKLFAWHLTKGYLKPVREFMFNCWCFWLRRWVMHLTLECLLIFKLYAITSHFESKCGKHSLILKSIYQPIIKGNSIVAVIRIWWHRLMLECHHQYQQCPSSSTVIPQQQQHQQLRKIAMEAPQSSRFHHKSPPLPLIIFQSKQIDASVEFYGFECKTDLHSILQDNGRKSNKVSDRGTMTDKRK